jgi:hypothetical protein
MNLITWAEPCLRHDLNLATAAMFAQCIAKHFPVLSAESKGAEESGLAGAVPMIRIEQIINDLLSFDQQPLATWKDQVRWSTGPRPSDAMPSRRVTLSASVHLAKDFERVVDNGQELSVIGPRLIHITSEFDETYPGRPIRLVPGMCRTDIECARIVPWCAWEGVGKTLQVID